MNAISTTLAGHRPGFTSEELDQFSEYSQDLKSLGFNYKTSGRVFKSDFGSCSIARLDEPIKNENSKGLKKYDQTKGKGERFFKQFLADSEDKSVIVVEGIYKALAAWKCGINAIAYSGINGTFLGSKVHPGLLELLKAFKHVKLGFDIDKRQQQQLYVEHHILKLDRQLIEHEKTVSIIDVWDKSWGKDFDEILVNKGIEFLTDILNSTSKAFDWTGISALNAYTATHTEDSKWITENFIELVSKHKYIFGLAAMGAGKTTSLGKILKQIDNEGTVIISPLKSLGRQITKDLREQGIDIKYRDDVGSKENWENIVCCLESISTKGKLKFKADGSQLEGKILVIDEVVKVIINLLKGSTIAKARVEVVELLAAILRRAEKCICLSADLTDFYVNCVLKLLGDTVKESEICKYENTCKRLEFQGYDIGSVKNGISLLLKLLSEGKRVFLGIDSQKTTSTYGTANIAELCTKASDLFVGVNEELGGELKLLDSLVKEDILILDSQTTTTKDHKAFEVVQRGNKALLRDTKLLICSPSVEAGFSLQKEDFPADAIITIHMGCTEPHAMVQIPMRIRDLKVPRYFAFGGNAMGNLALNGAITTGEAKAYINDQINIITKATNAKVMKGNLKNNGINDLFDLSLRLSLDGVNLEDEYIENQIISNIQKLNRKHIIFSALRAQGANIVKFDVKEILLEHFEEKREEAGLKNSTNKKNAEQIVADIFKVRAPLIQIKNKRIDEEANREFNAPELTEREVESLKEEPALTQEQQDSMSKFYAQKAFKYPDPSVEDLVDKKLGKLEPEENGIFLQECREYVEFSEQERILKQQEVPLYNTTKLLENDNKYIKLFKHDAIKGAKAHKIHLAESLGFTEALKYAKEHGLTDLFLMFKEVETFEIKGLDDNRIFSFNQKPEPILKFVANLREHKKEWCTYFNWQYNDCNRSEIKVFENVLKAFGSKFTDEEIIEWVETWLEEKINKKTGKVETKERKRTCRTKIFHSVTSTRSVKAREKRVNALREDIKIRFDKFTKVQEQVTTGLRLMSNEPVSNLIQEIAKELLLESAKLLPRTDFGLSKHSEICMDNNGFKANVDVPIKVVTPKNVAEFVQWLQECFKHGTEIGFDTETYGSAIHDAKCILKNGSHYWLNPHTGKLQEVKPGLDQNQNQVRLMQFSDGKQTFVVDFGRCDAPAIPLYLKEAWQQIIKLGEHNTFVGHNIKFDTSSVRKYGLIVKHPYCTMITTMLLFGDCGAGKVLGGFKEIKTLKNGKTKEVVGGGYGLKAVNKNLLNITTDKTEQLSDWGAEQLTESQIIYAAKDAVFPLVLKTRLELILENPEQWGFKEFADVDGKHANLNLIALENKNIYYTTEMQWRGVPVDMAKLKTCFEDLGKIKAAIERDWQELKMPCTPSQAQKIAEELDKRYRDREHPFDPEELAKALEVTLEDAELTVIKTLKLPEVTKEFKGTGKDVINEHLHLPEFQVLKAWRSYNTAETQLSKVLLSAETNNGVCRTEYRPLSGTGRMACGNEYGLGTPNLQAFVKKAEGKYFGVIPENGDTAKKFWEQPELSTVVKIREIFALTDTNRAFFTEDANASHARIAVAFGQCEFGRSVLSGMDGHSMFAMLALRAMLADNPNALDSFPQIRDFVNHLTEEQIRTEKTCTTFKELDKKFAGERFRNGAKTLFYSVLNGAQADKMRKVMTAASGSIVSAEVGTIMFDKFWNLYQGIAQYIKRILAEAETNSVNYGGIEFNITTLPDGVKLAYARKDGELAVTNLIACQWSRAEATALKKVMASVEDMPNKWGATLINMVHDEVGVTCNKEFWQEAYSFTSDKFAGEYNAYLKDFLPCDEPTVVKLQAKLAKDSNYIPTSWADK